MINPTNRYSLLQRFLIIVACGCAGYLSSSLADATGNKHPILDAKLKQLTSSPLRNHYVIPLTIETQYINGQGTTHLYLLSKIPFASFENFFGQNTWCEALILQIHIKACRQYKNDKLDIYLGNEDYAEPEDVFKFEYKVLKQQLEADYLHVSMAAEDGPMDSSNYHISLEIIPTKEGKSLVHFHFQAYYGFFTRAAINAYLVTVGRNKVGFSILQLDPTGQPTYQTGMKGIIERNAMRYVLAFFAYLETKSNGKSEHWLENSLQRWHHYTEEFYQQLYEISLQEYMRQKKLEYNNQLMLQKSSNEEWPDDSLDGP